MKEEIKYILESLRFKTSIYRDKKKRNLTFNDDEYYANILNEYIENLQSQLKTKEEENEQLKADYGNLAQVERDFLKEVIKEAREYANEEIRFVNMQEYHKLDEILSKGENK